MTLEPFSFMPFESSPKPPHRIARAVPALTRFYLVGHSVRWQGYYDSADAGMMDEDGQVYVMARDDDEEVLCCLHMIATVRLN